MLKVGIKTAATKNAQKLLKNMKSKMLSLNLRICLVQLSGLAEINRLTFSYLTPYFKLLNLFVSTLKIKLKNNC